LISDVGTGKRRLILGEKVGLLIFGFDIGEKNDLKWQKHLKVLKDNIIPTLDVGNPKGLRLPI
jgi:hypothetical protein